MCIRDRMFWGNGGGQKSGDYSSPNGKVVNSAIKAWDLTGGTGVYSDKGPVFIII